MQKERGFIGLLIVLLVTLILSKYFLNWSVFDAAATPQGQETVGYTHKLLSTIWNFLRAPFILFWNEIVLRIVGLLQSLHSGSPQL